MTPQLHLIDHNTQHTDTHRQPLDRDTRAGAQAGGGPVRSVPAGAARRRGLAAQALAVCPNLLRLWCCACACASCTPRCGRVTRTCCGAAASMPQVIFRLISGHSIRLDVEGSITVDQLRERMLPVYRELTDVPLHEMKLMFVKDEAQKNLFGRQTVKVELGNGRRSLQSYGVGKEAGQRALIVVLPTVRQWGLRMLIAIKLDDVERCRQAMGWHPSSTYWAVRREVRTVEIPVPDDFDEELGPPPAPEVVSYLTYGDFEAAGEDMPPLPDDFGRLEGGWVEGDTGLHLAVRNRAERVCQFLVETGAPLTAKNANGCTPLDEARKLRDNDGFVALLDRPQEDLMWQVTPRQGSPTPRAAVEPSPTRSVQVRHTVGGKAKAESGSPASPVAPRRRAPGSTPSPAALAAARAAAGIDDDGDESDGDADSASDGSVKPNKGSNAKAPAASAASNSPAPVRRTNNNPPAPVRRTNNNPPAPERRTNNTVAPATAAKTKTQEKQKADGSDTISQAAGKPKASTISASAKKKKGGFSLWGDGDEDKGSSWLTTPVAATVPEPPPEPETNDDPVTTPANSEPGRTLPSKEDADAAEAARVARAARLEREAAAKARR